MLPNARIVIHFITAANSLKEKMEVTCTVDGVVKVIVDATNRDDHFVNNNHPRRR